MNNIQKAFKAKAKLGLRMAVGGLIDPSKPEVSSGLAIMADHMQEKPITAEGLKTMDQNELDNAEKTKRWELQDMASKAKYTPSNSERSGLMSGLDHGYADYTKLFGQKTLELADGGVIEKETPDQVMARMAAKYGAPSAGPAQASAPQPAPAPAPVAAPQPKPSFFGGLRQALDPARRERAAGLAEGGIVRGAGGPTDDAVPMRVAGKDVNLSNKEAVLPAKTVQALGGPEAVEELIEKTNGKPPSKEGLRAGGEYEGGTVDVNKVDEELAQKNALAASTPNPTASVAPPKPWYAGTDTSDPRTGLELERARRVNGPVVTGDPVKQMLLTGTLGDGKTAPMGAPTAPVAAPTPVAENTQAGLPTGTTTLKDGTPDMTVKGTQRFADPTGAAGAAYAKAGYNTVSGLRGGQSAIIGENDDGQAARDKQFAAEGKKKDAFGNWTHITEGMKHSLDGIQRDRAAFDAFDPSITDPAARESGLRRMGMYETRDNKAAELAAKMVDTQLKVADLGLRKQGQENMQKNNERDAADKQNKERTDHIGKILDMHSAGADGKIDPTHRADMQRAFDAANGGQMNGLSDGDFQKNLPQAINQARLSSNTQRAMREAGVWNKYITNFGKKANTTLNASEMAYDPTSDTLDVGGYKLRGKDVWGDDMDLANLAKTTRQKKSN